MTAGLLVGLVAYVFFAFTLTVFGGAQPAQAFGARTALGAAAMWFVAWAVFSRPGAERPGGADGPTPAGDDRDPGAGDAGR